MDTIVQDVVQLHTAYLQSFFKLVLKELHLYRLGVAIRRIDFWHHYSNGRPLLLVFLAYFYPAKELAAFLTHSEIRPPSPICFVLH